MIDVTLNLITIKGSSHRPRRPGALTPPALAQPRDNFINDFVNHGSSGA